jgi:hypothetical protein
MYRSIRFISLVLVLMAVVSLVAMGQVQFKIPIQVTITGYATPDTVWLGVHGAGNPTFTVANTYGPDVDIPTYGALTDWRESMYPVSDPPTFHFVSKFLGIPNEPTVPPAGIGSSGLKPNDFRGFTNPNQVDTFHIKVYGDGVTSEVANGPITLSWPNTLHYYADTWVLKVKASGNFNTVAVADMKATLSYVDAATGANACEYYVIKTGARTPSAGPTIGLAPTSLNFGNVVVTKHVDMTVNVLNNGMTNPLTVSAVNPSNPAYTLVSPALPVTIAHDGSQAFVLRYTAQGSGGALPATVSFVSNDAGSPTPLAVTGTSILQGGTLGFVQIDTVKDNSAFLDTAFVNLTGYVGDTLNGLQFTLISHGKITMKPLVKIGLLAPDNWTMLTTTYHGALLSDLTRVDSVHVVLYANNNIGLTPAQITAQPNLLKFAYSTSDISVPFSSTSISIGSIKSAVLKNHVSGDAMLTGSDVGGLTSTESIVLRNRSTKGDANGDGVVDILDLIQLVDDVNNGVFDLTLDVSPWPAGDGVLDILDIVQLQSIIMDGKYPDGTPLSKIATGIVALAKSSASSVTFHVTKEGVAVRCNSVADLSGIEFILENIATTATSLSAKNGKLQDGVLHGVVYNMTGKQLEVGLVANFEMPISNPSAVRVSLVKGSTSGHEYAPIDQSISNLPAKELPVRFALHQNYPNPFNPSTVIEFAVPQTSQVRVVIYNLLGQEVRTLFSGQMNRGTKSIVFDGKDASGKTLATGTYIYRIQAGSFIKISS